jgi:hypothetical protein
MCYNVHEAVYLSSRFTAPHTDDFFVAYPATQTADLDAAWSLVMAQRRITLTVDSVGSSSFSSYTCVCVVLL